MNHNRLVATGCIVGWGRDCAADAVPRLLVLTSPTKEGRQAESTPPGVDSETNRTPATRIQGFDQYTDTSGRAYIINRPH